MTSTSRPVSTSVAQGSAVSARQPISSASYRAIGNGTTLVIASIPNTPAANTQLAAS